jgi:hypothetical protein
MSVNENESEKKDLIEQPRPTAPAPQGLDGHFLAANWGKGWFVGSVGVTALALLYCVGVSVDKSNASAAFFAGPYFVGFIVAVLSPKRPFRNATITLLVGLLGLIVTLREGILCVLMSLPLLLPELYLGVSCGAWIRHDLTRRSHQVIAVVLALVSSAAWQTYSGKTDRIESHPTYSVRAEKVLDAPPEVVFETLTSGFAVRRKAPTSLRIGFPVPGDIVFDEPRLDGHVTLNFNHGVMFAHLSDWAPGRRFALHPDSFTLADPPFFITRLGQGEHFGFKAERLTDWVTFQESDWDFLPAPDGKTKLVITNRFTSHLAPEFYFGRIERFVATKIEEFLLDSIDEQVHQPRIVERDGQSELELNS